MTTDSKDVKGEKTATASSKDESMRSSSPSRAAAEKVESDREAQAGSDRKSAAEQERLRQAEDRRKADAKARGERVDAEAERMEGVEKAGETDAARDGVRIVNRTGQIIRVVTERRSTDEANPGFERDTLVNVGPDDLTIVSIEENSRVVIDSV